MSGPGRFDPSALVSFCSSRMGVIEGFDAGRGLGVIRDAHGGSYRFHSTAIADGSRMISAGTAVRYLASPANCGQIEARDITNLSTD